MSLQIEKLEHNMAKLTIEVPAEELDKAIKAVYQKQKNQISIPGFRKGKVPLAMVEKMYGKGIFLEDAANQLIPVHYEKAYDECEEEIVSAPVVNVLQLEAGKPMIFTAEVALKPSVELGKYKGVKIEKIDTEVTEEEINEAIERERKNNSREITVDDRPLAMGDKANIDYEGFVDGEAFEGGKGEDYDLELGSHSFIDTFEDQLVGKSIGDEVDVNVTFPEQYHAEELAGKPALFKVKINGIKAIELPDLDDEFASEVSEYETFEEYKESVKKHLTEAKEKNAKDEREKAAIDAVIENSKMDIPEAMVETTQRQMLEEFSQRIQSQGLSFEQYMQFTGTSQETMLEQLKPQAELRIKSRLVLEAVMEKEKIEATEEDFEAEIKRMADMYNMDIEKAKDMVGEQGKQEIMKDLAITKAAEFVAENAKEGK